MSPFLLYHLLSELGCLQGPRQGLCHHVTVPLVPTQVSPLDLHNIQLQKETVLSQVAVVEISRKKASRLKRWDEVG